jgi:hypothetical protein
MWRIVLFWLFVSLILTVPCLGQVEGVIVERFYVSDANDATDTIGGGIAPGTTTYRVYVDLNQGSRIKRVYGDSNHPISINSTAPFFNHLTDGQTFGKDLSKARYGENTVALDSWLTIGQLTRNSTKTYFGLLKSDDTDGSFVGGANNDGGSAGISTGLLTNNDSTAGIPITVADGNDTMAVAANSFYSDGIVDPVSGNDSTIFGSLVAGNSFISTSAFLANSIGVAGKNPQTNHVLIGQFTTAGALSFKLNLIVEQPGTPFPIEVKYVSEFGAGEINSDTLRLCPSLTYPPVCGCLDPNYLEYSSSYSCESEDSCRTLIVFGCMDTMACNFNPDANYNLPTLCCYPGYCNDRDLSIVCPDLNFGRKLEDVFRVFPVPVKDKLTIEFILPLNDDSSLRIFSINGGLVYESDPASTLEGNIIDIPMLGLASGSYWLQIITGSSVNNRLIIKE